MTKRAITDPIQLRLGHVCRAVNQLNRAVRDPHNGLIERVASLEAAVRLLIATVERAGNDPR